MLARREAEIISSGNGKINGMNQELNKTFRNRTIEGIKGQRRLASYKALVQSYLEELRDVASSNNSHTVCLSSEGEVDLLKDYFENLQPLECEGHNARELDNICRRVTSDSKEEICTALGLFLLKSFPNTWVPKVRRIPPMTKSSKKALRRVEYARVQDLWKKDPCQCGKRILDDTVVQGNPLQRELLEPFWSAVFTKVKTGYPSLPPREATISSIVTPVNIMEIKKAYPPLNTAIGPDGLSVKQLRAVPAELLVRVYNLFMWIGTLPHHLCESRTILLPKKKNPSSPGDYRPITISSVLVRGYHKVLASRFKAIKIDSRQRAFRETDGCADNTIILDAILRYHHAHFKGMHLAILDVAKAFDSVSHETIYHILLMRGVPRAMIEYIMSVYHKSFTKIIHGNWCSEIIKPTVGVKQGDPLSPIIFNLVVDAMIKSAHNFLGVNLDGNKINILAFADDLILAAETQEGLQQLMDHASKFLADAGLDANIQKCATLTIKGFGKSKYTAIDQKTIFTLKGRAVTPLKRTDVWNYLGIKFDSNGRTKINNLESIMTQLERLSIAPLKPQQRLWIIRTILIPRMLHQLVLGDVSLGTLKRVDKTIRHFVRRWLHLPGDTPNAYFHATIKDGGLGISSLRWQVPALRYRRLRSIFGKGAIGNTVVNSYITTEINKAERRNWHEDSALTSSNQINILWARALYQSIDGKGLRHSRKVPNQHQWVGEGTRFLSGRDFVNSCRARINALPTKSRTARGRNKDRECRGGCGKVETLNHILQVCHRTHGPRIKRHDAITKFIGRNVTKIGYELIVEPKLSTEEGLRKPDLIAVSSATAVVIDAQVTNDICNLDLANKEKILKYKSNISLHDIVKNTYKVQNVEFLGVTLNWRGVWSAKSHEDLQRKGFLRKRDTKILSTRVIIGSLTSWNTFNRTTSVLRHKGRK